MLYVSLLGLWFCKSLCLFYSGVIILSRARAPVCVCVYIYVCMCVCVCVCMYVCVCVCVCIVYITSMNVRLFLLYPMSDCQCISTTQWSCHAHKPNPWHTISATHVVKKSPGMENLNVHHRAHNRPYNLSPFGAIQAIILQPILGPILILFLPYTLRRFTSDGKATELPAAQLRNRGSIPSRPRILLSTNCRLDLGPT